jgi:hypothetical protein
MTQREKRALFFAGGERRAARSNAVAVVARASARGVDAPGNPLICASILIE